jgi:hypothetical protein
MEIVVIMVTYFTAIFCPCPAIPVPYASAPDPAPDPAPAPAFLFYAIAVINALTNPDLILSYFILFYFCFSL